MRLNISNKSIAALAMLIVLCALASSSLNSKLQLHGASSAAVTANLIVLPDK